MKFLLAFALLIFAGCLKPDATGPAQGIDNPKIEDNELLAGATSSTNWPPVDGGSRPLSIAGTADTNLVLKFIHVFSPVSIAAKVSFFQGGVIPAIDSNPSFSIEFPAADSISIPRTVIERLAEGAVGDVISFTLRIESDTLQCLLLGFSYSMKDKKFTSSPFSAFSGSPFLLTKPIYSISGVADSSLAKFGPSIQGKTGWCFYIPGSPYFWQTRISDTVDIGPVPYGVFPFRLLKIIRPEGSQLKYRLEAYEVKKSLISPESKNFVIQVGKQILSFESSAPISIRSDHP
jgi:hypothetical protein